MKKTNKKIKVIIAMSGGVDSSVAAYLLKKQGYDVTGVFMHFWAESPSDEMPLEDFVNRCCSLEAEKVARGVCEKIGIPFYVLNVSREFKKAVVDYFLSDLRRGNTPNPCVVCNKEIKFKFLLERALEFGADFIATGHYARIKKQIAPRRKKSDSRGEIYKLLKAKDKNKDQSYFLYNVTQGQLAHCLFPIGDYLKPEIRKIAKRLGLPSAERPESQEICFIADNDIRRFIKQNLDLVSGEIADTAGKIIGLHSGLPLFTIGQRHGLGIGGGKPYYVAAPDYKTNHLIVTSNSDDKVLYRKELLAQNVNWVSGEAPEEIKCEAAIRYRHKSEKARVAPEGKNYRVVFAKPQRAVAPGQSVVFYEGEEVLGGGVICG